MSNRYHRLPVDKENNVDRILRQLAKVALAALFGAASTSAIFATAAIQAGSPATGLLAATATPALADRVEYRRYGYYNRNYGYWLGGRFFITIAYSSYQPAYYPAYYPAPRHPIYYTNYYPNYGYRTYYRDDRYRRVYVRDDRRRFDRDRR
jgi:hypothetical protein